MRVYKGISGSALGRVASAMGLSTRTFRRGRVAHRITAMGDPELTELGGNGVNLTIRSAEHPEFPPLNPNQVYMPNPREQYVVVEDTANGPWITSGGILVSVYQVEDDGTIVQEIPGDFVPEYDDYLKTGEEPIGQGSEWSVVLDYFNLDIAEIDRWKDEVLESLKTGRRF